MIEISSFIVSNSKPFQTEDTIEKAQRFFNKNNHSHFPVIKDGIYIGSIQSEDVFTFEASKKIIDYLYTCEQFFVRENTPWLDVLETFAQNQTDIMPVLSIENKYLGFYELNAIYNVLTNTPFIREIGGSLVVEIPVKDYSMSQIAQIIESNNSKILGSIITYSDEFIVQITLKIVSGNMNEVIQSFRRFNYQIISKHQDDSYMEKLSERSAYLDKYLSI